MCTANNTHERREGHKVTLRRAAHTMQCNAVHAAQRSAVQRSAEKHKNIHPKIQKSTQPFYVKHPYTSNPTRTPSRLVSSHSPRSLGALQCTKDSSHPRAGTSHRARHTHINQFNNETNKRRDFESTSLSHSGPRPPALASVFREF